jgi:ribosomal protein L11 methyltransferase
VDWREVSWLVQAEDRDVLEELLQELGALAVSTAAASRQAVFESPGSAEPVWRRVRVTALFEASRDLGAVDASVQTVLNGRATERQQRSFHDRDWVQEWSRGLRTRCFADRIWVVPCDQRPPEAASCVVFMDPGLAFGSGTHETTRMCLEWLAQADLQGRHVLDYGCGSGLLGIAALKRGAASVVGCDTDARALQVTRDNARRNEVADRLSAGFPDDIADRCGDVLMANILLDALRDYATLFARCVVPGGTIVLSGVLTQQLDELLEVYAEAFEAFEVRRLHEWVCVVGRRRLTKDCDR